MKKISCLVFTALLLWGCGDNKNTPDVSGIQVKNEVQRFDVDYFPITIEEHLKLYRNCGFATVEILWFSCIQAGFYCIK